MKQEQTKLTKEQKEAVGLLTIGTFLEYFDIMLYVHMAVFLNTLFFPKTDPYTTDLLTAFAFCSTYLLRPFGALIFGLLGDHIGRKKTVIITTIMMAISCLIMANLPTYSQIGIAAAWIVTICRIIQGMSSMGEITGAQLCLSESLKPPIRYVSVALLAFVVSIGTSVALGVASLVTSHGLNWRLAFWIGATIALIGAKARTRLKETPEFANAKEKLMNVIEKANLNISQVKNNHILWKEKANKKTALYLFLMDCMWPLCFYFVYIHCGNILKNSIHNTPEQIIQNNFIVSIIQLLGVFLFVVLSYKFYPLFILKVKCSISFILILSCPYWLNNFETKTGVLLLQCLVIFFACDSAPATAIFYKYFPIFKRFTYVGFAYALSRSLTYIVTSFGFVYLNRYFGSLGLLIIMIPIFIGFILGLRYFEKLEKNSGAISNKSITIFN